MIPSAPHPTATHPITPHSPHPSAFHPTPLHPTPTPNPNHSVKLKSTTNKRARKLQKKPLVCRGKTLDRQVRCTICWLVDGGWERVGLEVVGVYESKFFSSTHMFC